jgi:hypothetical protein
MRHYLATLHTRSEEHKRRFAFLVAGSTTLAIFAIWSMATFGNGGYLAKNGNNPDADRAHPEISPLESLRANAASSFGSIRDTVNDLKAPVESVNLNPSSQYGE